MKHPERVHDYLAHIAEAIERATRYLQDLKSVDALQQNQQVQDAVVRNIEVIGEAANNIQRMDSDFAANHPELPWIGMRGMRNKVIQRPGARTGRGPYREFGHGDSQYESLA
jgi:uncharacterized protein with HEPN domain